VARPTEPRDSYASRIRIPHSSPSAQGNSHLVKRLSFASPRGGREPYIKAKEPKARSADGADDLVGGETFFGCHHLSTDGSVHLPTNTAPASAGHPKSAPAGPHPRPRHENENGTVPEHEYRPHGVRRVVGPSGAAGHSRPDRGRNAAPWPGSSSSPSPAWLEDASSAELEDGFHPQMPEVETGHQPTQRQAPAQLAPPPRPSKDDEDP
jgi:hypothetical protein